MLKRQTFRQPKFKGEPVKILATESIYELKYIVKEAYSTCHH